MLICMQWALPQFCHRAIFINNREQFKFKSSYKKINKELKAIKEKYEEIINTRKNQAKLSANRPKQLQFRISMISAIWFGSYRNCLMCHIIIMSNLCIATEIIASVVTCLACLMFCIASNWELPSMRYHRRSRVYRLVLALASYRSRKRVCRYRIELACACGKCWLAWPFYVTFARGAIYCTNSERTLELTS